MARVRCPSPSCRAVFPVDTARLGRQERCPACGIGLTARPIEVDERLRRQQESVRGLDRSPLPRWPLRVIVDSVRSLWNVGSIFRTADAFGVEHLVLTGITGCPPRPEISKTALGAEKVVAWSYRTDAADAIREADAAGYVPVAVETSSRAVDVHRFRWPDRPALVIGNEVAGVSPAALDACRRHVRIPMHGVKDSLNVAVAFGIVAQAAAVSFTARDDAEPLVSRDGDDPVGR